MVGTTISHYKVIENAVCCAILILSLIVVATAAPLSRPADPVVLRGDNLPMFKGTPPDSLVAFRYEDGWVQIPVQVDDRDVANPIKSVASTSVGARSPSRAEKNCWR